MNKRMFVVMVTVETFFWDNRMEVLEEELIQRKEMETKETLSW